MSKLIRAYCRVSTDLQYDSGVSLDVQETRITALCVAQGHSLLKVYKDVGSGKNTNRPQLQLLLLEISPGETIAILDLSRLSRSAKDTLNIVDEFDKRGIGIISVTENIDTTSPQGRFMMTLVSALNQMERENTAKKVSETMQVLSTQGKLRGKPPFGWKFFGKDRDFEPVPNQQLVLSKIISLHSSLFSMNKIAFILNSNGDNLCLSDNKKSPSKLNPSLFYQSTIKRILVENGIIDGGNLKRKPVEQQIISHHKPSISSSPLPLLLLPPPSLPPILLSSIPPPLLPPPLLAHPLVFPSLPPPLLPHPRTIISHPTLHTPNKNNLPSPLPPLQNVTNKNNLPVALTPLPQNVTNKNNLPVALTPLPQNVTNKNNLPLSALAQNKNNLPLPQNPLLSGLPPLPQNPLLSGLPPLPQNVTNKNNLPLSALPQLPQNVTNKNNLPLSALAQNKNNLPQNVTNKNNLPLSALAQNKNNLPPPPNIKY